MTEPKGPTTRLERIQSLDILRGVAVLGILVMNIQTFSMIGAAYSNPTTYGDFTGLNFLVWLLSHVFFQGKFLAIFSMLFGAGIVLMAERMEARGMKPAAVHYRRLLVLLFIGVAHAWLLWPGDILYAYAVCGLLVFLFRNRRPRTLFLWALFFFLLSRTVSVLGQQSLPNWPDEYLVRLAELWSPSQERIASELEIVRGGWSAQNELRFMQARSTELGLFFLRTFWRVTALMLAGMGLYKLGVFSATLPARSYKRMTFVGLALGLPLIVAGVRYNFATDWAVEFGFFRGGSFNSWGSILTALGWIGLVMLFCQSDHGVRIKKALAATGQMALTNYLMQTIICTTLFFGHGFGLYGRVERTGQILIVFAIWALQLLWSPPWLARFRFGPFEWLWRSLTYWKLQPMRR